MKLSTVVTAAFVAVATADHCDAYCQSITAECTGENKQYDDIADCQAQCPKFVKNLLPGSYSGDTFECRNYYLKATAGKAGADLEKAAHCAEAGPSGGGVCVKDNRCEVFCQHHADTCTGVMNQYGTIAECKNKCNKYEITTLIGSTLGDSLECREYHQGIAAMAGEGAEGNEFIHCPHASFEGGGKCVETDECEVFCEANLMICDNGANGNNVIYDTKEECMQECAGFSNKGTNGDTTGDSLQCRAYHLGVAASTSNGAGGPAVHCLHTAPESAPCSGNIPQNGATAAAAGTAAFAIAMAGLML